MSVLESGTSITAISATFIHNGNGRVIIHLETQMSKRCFIDSGVFFTKLEVELYVKVARFQISQLETFFNSKYIIQSYLPVRKDGNIGRATHLTFS